ncbi:MAG: hypothetical protein KGH63_01580 [Candidatus Micrarchaeota archaeon]|nr:hypothetical protein [Candidatus Micrarchaeota archaeon]
MRMKKRMAAGRSEEAGTGQSVLERLRMYPGYSAQLRNVIRSGVGSTIETRPKDPDSEVRVLVGQKTMETDAQIVERHATKNGAAYGPDWIAEERGARDFSRFFRD